MFVQKTKFLAGSTISVVRSYFIEKIVCLPRLDFLSFFKDVYSLSASLIAHARHTDSVGGVFVGVS